MKKKLIVFVALSMAVQASAFAATAVLKDQTQPRTSGQKLLDSLADTVNVAMYAYKNGYSGEKIVAIAKNVIISKGLEAVLGTKSNNIESLTIPDYQADSAGPGGSATEINASTVDIGGIGSANGGETGAGNGTGIAANGGGYGYDYGSGGTAAGTESLSDSTYSPGSGFGGAAGGFSGDGAYGTLGGSLGGVIGGMQNQISSNAGYSVSVNGPQYVTAKVEMDPPNPLKNKPISITSTFVTLALPTGASVVPDRTSQTETLSYDTAGTYTKTYTFGYDYYPPPDSHGNRPPTQHGTVTVTVKFNVNEFSSFGGSSGGQYGDINSGGGTTVVGGLSSGGTSLNVSGGNMNGSGGYQLPQGDGVLSSAASGLNSAANGLSTAAGGISDAIRSVLTGDMPIPWGRMTTGSEPVQNGISLAIPGFSGVGEGLYSVANSIQAVLGNRKSDHPAGIDAAETARAENGGKLQSDKTADQVRSEAMTDGSMNSILATASKILAARGVKATTAADFAKLYEDSPYTSPTDAWDMNRLDKIVTTKTATRIDQK